MPTAETMRQAVYAYVDAFEKGDPTLASNLFADDATVEDPVGTPLKRGKAEIHEFYAASVKTGAKLFLQEPIRVGKDYAAFAFQVRLHYGGSDMVIDVIDTFKFNDDGKIIEMRAFFGPDNMRT